jgi:hypothetical protein
MFMLKILAVLILVHQSHCECNQYSPERYHTWTFTDKQIQCQTIPKEIHLCDMYDTSNDLTCSRKNKTSKGGAIQEGILMHWTCDSDYQFYVKCSEDFDMCNDSLQDCVAVYNPSMETLTYITIVLAVTFSATVCALCMMVMYNSKYYIYLMVQRSNGRKAE